MKILFLTESREDYLADSLLHGLIELGCDVTDYPRKDILYSGKRSDRARGLVRGGGFSLYGKLVDRDIDRTAIQQRIEAGEFEIIIIGQAWRQWGQLMDLASDIHECMLVILDGDDDKRIFHGSKTCMRRYGLHRFPVRNRRTFYLKRELQTRPGRRGSYNVGMTSFSIPEVMITEAQEADKIKEFGSHCVDDEVMKRKGLKSSYVFNTESDYYEDIRLSKYVITTKRSGWDCLRHYEIAAGGAVQCFRDLHKKPKYSAPHGLEDMVNCVSYASADELAAKLSFVESSGLYADLLSGSKRWIMNMTTKEAARRMLLQLSSL